jgi:BirA family biotin operon repressor/biotin-[acetyl-CoA-carboxylase] ligase
LEPRSSVDPLGVRSALGLSESRWPDIRVVDVTESTNADLLAVAGSAPDRSVLVAELQQTGRGRLDRRWVSPARAGLTFSVLLRPRPPVATWGWLPLLAGVALHDALVGRTDVALALKWPNDLLIGVHEAKAAGILAQIGHDAVVIGIGINVSTTEAELPIHTATSLALAGVADLDRTSLLADILRALDDRYGAWQAFCGDAVESGLARDYEQRCVTIGRSVRVTLATREITGRAVGVGSDGRLLLETAEGQHALAAGDVEHLRASGGP